MNKDFRIYQSFLDNLDMSVFILDGQCNYLYVNPHYCKATNKTVDFFLSHSIPILKSQGYINQAASEIACQRKKKVNALVTIKNDLDSVPYEALTTCTPILDDDGHVLYVCCVQEPVHQIINKLKNATFNKLNVNYSASDTADAAAQVIAESPQMKQIISTLKTIAKTDVSILFSGPSGSGKEVLAKFTHNHSQRAKKPLIVINCSAIPENLIESELFGYVKGAFTGASQSGKVGLIEAADGGTLFLDEINSIPKNIQIKLLRVLETKQITPIGATKPKDIDFRLICATNEDLKKLVDIGEFRMDLYYRINVFGVVIPPLKERKEDLTALAAHFTNKFNQIYNTLHFLSPQVLHQIENMPWEGNVRELKNFIERLIVSTDADVIEIADIPEFAYNNLNQPVLPAAVTTVNTDTHPGANLSPDYDSHDFSYHTYMDNIKKALLIDALEKLGSPKAVAQKFKLDQSNIYRKMKKYNITQ